MRKKSRVEKRRNHMKAKRSATRCKGLTSAGKPCRAAATPGGLCFLHANPNKASELGRKGGRSNRHFATTNLEPLPMLETARAVRDALDKLIADLYSGEVHP